MEIEATRGWKEIKGTGVVSGSGAWLSPVGNDSRPLYFLLLLRPGGPPFAACISRFASLLDGLARNLVDDPAFFDILKVDPRIGRLSN